MIWAKLQDFSNEGGDLVIPMFEGASEVRKLKDKK
jgi:hypothetical protein